jgi:hypothetical protein
VLVVVQRRLDGKSLEPQRHQRGMAVGEGGSRDRVGQLPATGL